VFIDTNSGSQTVKTGFSSAKEKMQIEKDVTKKSCSFNLETQKSLLP
jgi:hypothetical protein